MFANIFSHSSRWTFCFVDSFLHCAKAFLLQCSLICLFFSFVSLDWGDTSKKILLRPDVKEWTAFIFPVSIMVSGLTFMSWINLKFIFCAWYDRVVQFGSVGYLSKENKNTNKGEAIIKQILKVKPSTKKTFYMFKGLSEFQASCPTMQLLTKSIKEKMP